MSLAKSTTEIVNRLASEKAVTISNLSAGGSKTTDWSAAVSYNGKELITAAACKLYIISLGANDAGSAVTPAVYNANIRLIANAAAVSGKVILASIIRSQDPTLLALELQYASECQAIASELGYYYYDLGAAIGNYDAAVYFDVLHPNTLGYAQIAQILQSDIFGGVL